MNTPNLDNSGQKWTDKEETILLEELNQNINIDLISQNHKRTVGGIHSRCREIAYKMFINNISMEEIINKTKLNEKQIIETIKKRKNTPPKKIKPIIEPQKLFSLENEVIEMKNDIKELKSSIKELIEMIKAVYDFVDA